MDFHRTPFFIYRHHFAFAIVIHAFKTNGIPRFLFFRDMLLMKILAVLEPQHNF